MTHRPTFLKVGGPASIGERTTDGAAREACSRSEQGAAESLPIGVAAIGGRNSRGGFHCHSGAAPQAERRLRSPESVSAGGLTGVGFAPVCPHKKFVEVDQEVSWGFSTP